jgi:glutamate synthase domain-containing protein 2/glutamate synthase domain-containing protein 3
MSESAWFACRYLLRLALDHGVGDAMGEQFSVVSLSNRTIVYKSLCALSKIGDFYPELRHPDYATRFVLFHSRYCTNTTTAWKRAQPFWAIAHNGEIATIKGNVAWIEAKGQDLIGSLVESHPTLSSLAERAGGIIARGGSDTANLDDMVIALLAGGMTLKQALLALLPEASNQTNSRLLAEFAQSMSVYLGACDGPAAIVACDGDEAVAHLDRNGLRPLWFGTTSDYALAVSEMTGTFPHQKLDSLRILGPGETVAVKLSTGQVLFHEEIREEVSRGDFPSASYRITQGQTLDFEATEPTTGLKAAFGMTKEDEEILIKALSDTGKPAVGSMGDDTPPAAMLDRLPRRLEDYFVLRFAQETSPPIDPIRDAWVFDGTCLIGDRSGLWRPTTEGKLYSFDRRVLSRGQVAWLRQQDTVTLDLTFEKHLGEAGLEARLEAVIQEGLSLADQTTVLLLDDSSVSSDRVALPILRVTSRLHDALVKDKKRHRVGIVAAAGVWDIHHVALLVSFGADAVCPWLGCATAGGNEEMYVQGLQSGFVEAMSMMGITPAAAYSGAKLVEAVGLSEEFLAKEFPGTPCHLPGVPASVINQEWLSFHDLAFSGEELANLPDVGEFRHTKEGRPHANNAEVVRSIHLASGYRQKMHDTAKGTQEAYQVFRESVNGRPPLTPLDCIKLRPAPPVSLADVEPLEFILWRFMAPGMSEGALSEPAHRAVARGMNILRRACLIAFAQKGAKIPPGIGPIANSGEGGFEKSRMTTRDGNGSVQYAGGRFTITPATAALAREAEVKFAQGAKPGKGGQLPGKKVGRKVAHQRGCEPGYELVSPPINHNLYSIEDVKLMVESWRHLNPQVNCALKYVATHGVEMVALGGVHAGANRLHFSDGGGGTGAAKRVDQKHAGIPLVAVLPTVQDILCEDGLRELVEISVDGGIQTGEQALKLMLMGADKVGFGTSLLMAIGCSMLRKCHLAGPDPSDPTGKKRLGCTPGVATQDPIHIARFSGKGVHIARFLVYVAQEIRELMAAHGIVALKDVIGQRERLVVREDLTGKARHIRFAELLLTPGLETSHRDLSRQTQTHMPKLRHREVELAGRALQGEKLTETEHLTNADRCVGVGAAGVIARSVGDLGLSEGRVSFRHTGAAGHYYGAYSVEGLSFELTGVAGDSCFTAAYGGELVILSQESAEGLTVVGNTFGYGARGGRAFLRGRAGNRFGICFRKNHEGGGPQVVVEGVGANAFQYMTGGTALVLGSTGSNLGSGMTGGTVFLLDAELGALNSHYVGAHPLDEEDCLVVRSMIADHLAKTRSPLAAALLTSFDPDRFLKVVTSLAPEPLDDLAIAKPSPSIA